MKKFGKYFVVAMIVVAATAAVLVGCKKDEQTSGEQEKSVSGYDETQQPSESEEKIISFINDYECVKKGEKAEGEDMSLEDARWLWETTMNYCYGFTQSHLSGMRQDTLCFICPKANADGYVLYIDVLETYNAIINDARKSYCSIDMDDKTLQFVTMSFVNDNEKNGNSKLLVIMNTGRDDTDNTDNDHPLWYGVPFTEDVCWKFGRNLGSCTYPYILDSDAAQEIEKAIAAYDLSHETPHLTCTNCETYMENIYVDTAYYYPNETTDSIFYASGLTWNEVNDYCICKEEMNMYYAWIMKKTHYENMVINPYDVDWYYCVKVDGCSTCQPDGLYTIYHLYRRYNGTRRFRVNRNYPVSLDNEN